MKKKEVLSLEQIRKELSSKKEVNDKKKFLKSLIIDSDYKDVKKDLIKEFVPILLGNPLTPSYNLIYDSLSEGLEPIYFWVLDFMRDSSPGGLKLDVWKGNEDFEASVSGGYFGEIGQRSSLMQQKSMEYLGVINNILKSVLNLIYDLKEFEIKIDPYDRMKNMKLSVEERDGAYFSLKGIWMDQVDSRKGRGSINLLAQDLQFVTLRDAFFYVRNQQDIIKVDLNERVKNILRRKLEEFNIWLDISEKEIKKRYEIEKIYLKSQVGTLRLYASWLKPYLIAAQKLKMRSASVKSLVNPNIVNSFSNMEIELKLYGKKEIKPGDIHESFSDVVLDKKYFSVIEVVLKFRSVPSSIAGQGGRHFVHAGRTDITFNSFAMDDVELEAVEAVELYEDLDLINDYVDGSLTQLQKEIDKYLNPPKEEKKEDKNVVSVFDNPFKGVFSGLKEVVDPIKETFFSPGKNPVVVEEIGKVSSGKAKSLNYTLYNSYKKSHGMLSI